MRKLAVALVLSLSTLCVKSALAQEDSLEAPPPPPIDDQEETQAPPPPEAQPPAQPPSQQSFDQQLSPYGRWVDTPEYGRVWIPSGLSSDWQPYSDGRWIDTTYGWTFVAGVPWGWATYHYGRWGWRAGFGWYWVPGYVWGPGWVSWRFVNGYACWSPLGPRGYAYPRYWPGWVVVPYRHFTHPIPRWRVPPGQVGVIVRSARPVRSFPSYRAQTFIGPGHVGHGHHGHGRRR